MPSPQDPQSYVNENTDTLGQIIKHSSSTFTRALALAALVEYGDEPAVADVMSEIEQLQELRRGEDK